MADGMTGRDTSTLRLPGGFLSADGQCKDQATLRPLTGQEEEWLMAHPEAPSAVAVTHLLAACLVSLNGEAVSPGTVRSLLVGDRDFLMLHLRQLTLGDRIRAVYACPGCSARMDIDFSTEEVPVEVRRQTKPYEQMELSSGRAVRFRLPNGGDQEAVLDSPPENRVPALIARCLDAEDAPRSESEIQEISDAMERLAPKVEIDLDLTCPECGHAFTAPCDVTSLFLGEMRSQARGFLREVHFIAFYYHWSEQEILSLTRNRRREYLALLDETLRAV